MEAELPERDSNAAQMPTTMITISILVAKNLISDPVDIAIGSQVRLESSISISSLYQGLVCVHFSSLCFLSTTDQASRRSSKTYGFHAVSCSKTHGPPSSKLRFLKFSHRNFLNVSVSSCIVEHTGPTFMLESLPGNSLLLILKNAFVLLIMFFFFL